MQVFKRALATLAIAAMPLSSVVATSAHAQQDEVAATEEGAEYWLVRIAPAVVLVSLFIYVAFIDDEEDTVSP